MFNLFSVTRIKRSREASESLSSRWQVVSASKISLRNDVCQMKGKVTIDHDVTKSCHLLIHHVTTTIKTKFRIRYRLKIHDTESRHDMFSLQMRVVFQASLMSTLGPEMMALMTPLPSGLLPLRVVSNASRACVNGKRCDTRGLTSTLPDAARAIARG